jgi:hypothetical protein
LLQTDRILGDFFAVDDGARQADQLRFAVASVPAKTVIVTLHMVAARCDSFVRRRGREWGQPLPEIRANNFVKMAYVLVSQALDEFFT